MPATAMDTVRKLARQGKPIPKEAYASAFTEAYRSLKKPWPIDACCDQNWAADNIVQLAILREEVRATELKAHRAIQKARKPKRKRVRR